MYKKHTKSAKIEKKPLKMAPKFLFRRLKLSILYPATTGRNFDEVLRVIDSLQLTAVKKVATPADWQNGGSCMVVPSIKAEQIPDLFPKGVTIHDVPSGKQYLRTTPQPE